MKEGTPTSLAIFNIQEPQLTQLGDFNQRAVTFRLQSERARDAFTKLGSIDFKSPSGPSEEEASLTAEIKRMAALGTVNLMYNRVMTEARERGANDQEAFELFEKCLEINTRVFESAQPVAFIGMYGKAKSSMKGLIDFTQSRYGKIIKVDSLFRGLFKIPDWFQSDGERDLDWVTLASKKAMPAASSDKEPNNTFATRRDLIPDWLVKAREEGVPADLDQVMAAHWELVAIFDDQLSQHAL